MRINNYYTCNKTNVTHKTSQQNGPHDSGLCRILSIDGYYRTVPQTLGVTGAALAEAFDTGGIQRGALDYRFELLWNRLLGIITVAFRDHHVHFGRF